MNIICKTLSLCFKYMSVMKQISKDISPRFLTWKAVDWISTETPKSKQFAFYIGSIITIINSAWRLIKIWFISSIFVIFFINQFKQALLLIHSELAMSLCRHRVFSYITLQWYSLRDVLLAIQQGNNVQLWMESQNFLNTHYCMFKFPVLPHYLCCPGFPYQYIYGTGKN